GPGRDPAGLRRPGDAPARGRRADRGACIVVGQTSLEPNPTAVVTHRAALPRVYGSGTRAPAAGAPFATPTTSEPARPASAGPTPAAAGACAPQGRSAG